MLEKIKAYGKQFINASWNYLKLTSFLILQMLLVLSVIVIPALVVFTGVSIGGVFGLLFAVPLSTMLVSKVLVPLVNSLPKLFGYEFSTENTTQDSEIIDQDRNIARQKLYTTLVKLKTLEGGNKLSKVEYLFCQGVENDSFNHQSSLSNAEKLYYEKLIQNYIALPVGEKEALKTAVTAICCNITYEPMRNPIVLNVPDDNKQDGYNFYYDHSTLVNHFTKNRLTNPLTNKVITDNTKFSNSNAALKKVGLDKPFETLRKFFDNVLSNNFFKCKLPIVFSNFKHRDVNLEDSATTVKLQTAPLPPLPRM